MARNDPSPSSEDSRIFELCAQTLEACCAGSAGGADRIELCCALQVGGLTPSDELKEEAVQQSGLPVHILIRPHAHGFAYDEAALDAMRRSIEKAQTIGAAGVVFGVLHPGGTVDVERTRELVTLAGPMQTTFHRAFDETPDLDRALEDVIATGCQRILTSGGAPDVLTGADTLARLVKRANGRVLIAAGGGLRLSNVREVRDRTRAPHFHGSLLHLEGSGPASLQSRVRAMVQALRAR